MSDSEMGWLKSRLEHVQAELDKVDAKLEQAQAENQRLREAFFRYGKHDAHCYVSPCTCSLTDVLKEVE